MTRRISGFADEVVIGSAWLCRSMVPFSKKNGFDRVSAETGAATETKAVTSARRFFRAIRYRFRWSMSFRFLATDNARIAPGASQLAFVDVVVIGQVATMIAVFSSPENVANRFARLIRYNPQSPPVGESCMQTEVP